MKIDVILNLFFPIFIFIWLFFHFDFFRKFRLKSKSNFKSLCFILWIAFIVFLIFVIKYFSILKELHDIDDAINGAVKGYLKGINPYKEEIVPRFAEFKDGKAIMKNSTFNYPPTCLYIYSVFYILLNPIIDEFWYPITNIIIGILIFFIFSLTFPEISKLISFPIIGSIFLLFIFDNIVLTLFFVSISFYFIINSTHSYRHFFALLFLLIGASIKLIGSLSLAVLFLYILQKYKLNKNLLLFILIAPIFLLITTFPFGIYNVIYSTIFYFSNISIRSQTSIYGGTFLVYILGNSPYFTIISNICITALIITSLFIKNLYSKLFLPESLLPLFTIQASRSLLLIPFYILLIFIILKLYPHLEKSGEAINLNP